MERIKVICVKSDYILEGGEICDAIPVWVSERGTQVYEIEIKNRPFYVDNVIPLEEYRNQQIDKIIES